MLHMMHVKGAPNRSKAPFVLIVLSFYEKPKPISTLPKQMMELHEAWKSNPQANFFSDHNTSEEIHTMILLHYIIIFSGVVCIL